MEAGTLATQHACATLTPFREIQPNPMLDFGCGRVARIVVGRVARIEYTVPDTSQQSRFTHEDIVRRWPGRRRNIQMRPDHIAFQSLIVILTRHVIA